MAVMPRQNLGQIKARVRELTGIYSSDIYSDDRIKKLVNETLYSIIKIADDLQAYITDKNAGGNFGKPILVTKNSQTYRFPGWRFDNPTVVGGSNNNDLIDYIYMNSDTDVAPWNGNVGETAMGGYYDNILIYKAASDMLQEVGDTSNRAQFFLQKFNEHIAVLQRDEFIEWNFILSELITSTDANYIDAVAMKVLRSLDRKVDIDTLPSLTQRCSNAALASKDEFYSAHTWPFANTWNNFGTPWPFVFEAAAKVGLEIGSPEQTIKGWLSEAETGKQKLIRDFITSVYGSSYPATLVDLRKQTRALLSDFSKDLPEQIIVSWINEAYQNLCLEKNWAFLEQEVFAVLPINTTGFQLDIYGSRKILDMYVVKQNGLVTGAGIASDDVEIISQVPHVHDSKVNDARFRYDVDATGFVTISPAPLKEEIQIKIKYIKRAGALIADLDGVEFNPEFAMILAYRAAMKGIMLNPSGKKLYEVYDLAQRDILKSMINFYQLDHSTEPFSMGELGVEERKYIPFFKVG